MTRSLPVLAGCLALVLCIPSAASAGRYYGAQRSLAGLAVMRISDDARHLTDAAVRVWPMCPDRRHIELAAPVRVVSRWPVDAANARMIYLVRVASEDDGQLRYHLHHQRGGGSPVRTGTLTLSRVTGGSLRLTVQVELRPHKTPCKVILTARRSPGTLYVGSSDQAEPVWVERKGANVRFLAGYNAACSPSGHGGGVLGAMAPSTTPTTFSVRAVRTSPHFYDITQVAGAFAADQVTGTFSYDSWAISITVGGGLTECHNGVHSWQATSG